jgi:DNA polymerase III epsilon subunit family exonuclease
LTQLVREATSSHPIYTIAAPHTASESQRAAIEAELGPVLVLAGPGAGKTFCLIERIRFLVEKRDIDPARICAFTFTNKAAGEISSRLEKYLGPAADEIHRGTLHAFCAKALREFGQAIELEPGFGVADEEYSIRALRRVGDYRKWPTGTLKRFTAMRFKAEPISGDDVKFYRDYGEFLAKRNMLDFDQLVLRTADLMRVDSVVQALRSRWDCVLIDEFQDLNRVQYAIIKALAWEHRNVFAVGDDEQSIYSWAGADPVIFRHYSNDFNVTTRAQLGENRRCPREVVSLSRTLVASNTPIFSDRKHGESDRSSPFPILAHSFDTEREELLWILDDLKRDREANGLSWGDYALLYRTHEIGYNAEAGFLTSNVPCKMAQGRALADDPVVGYLVAALRVISAPDDPVHQERFLQVVLPRALFDGARAKSDEGRTSLARYLQSMARALPKDHGDRRKIARAFVALRNLEALAASHAKIDELVDELLSQRVGEYRTVLEENHDELSDPAEFEEVEVVAKRLKEAVDFGRTVWIPRMGGCEIAIKGLLAGAGINRVQLGGISPDGAVSLGNSDLPTLGIALGVFKAVQLMRSSAFTNHFRDFTAIDVETTDRDIGRAELVEIAATRVRNGRIVDEFHRLIKPRVPISMGARGVHGYTEFDLADAPYFEEVWPEFREFCGRDVLVAHNGYHFDFPIIRRMAKDLGDTKLSTYDTLVLARELHSGGARLEDLCNVYGVTKGRLHHALDDTRALAKVFLCLGDTKVARARKTALDNLLDFVSMALALSDESTLCDEAKRLAGLIKIYPLGRYSSCLEFYRAECEKCHDSGTASVDDLIKRLGGHRLMENLRADKTADDRYPGAMNRLRPLIDLFGGKPLGEQICGFLERVALSKMDGIEADDTRVNLLTLHSTKGLEFSRVYIVGAEDVTFQVDRTPGTKDLEEARRLMYVGITRTKDRLVFTRVNERSGKPSGGHRFLEEMGLQPVPPS